MKFVDTPFIGSEIEKLVTQYGSQRKSFERRWYNNNFFDDGYHYRFVSRTTGKVVDLSSSRDTFIPYRAIPKASRQIRGIANLLMASEPVPVVYPERLTQSNFPDPNSFQQAMKENMQTAKKVGNWITNWWLQNGMKSLLTQMLVLSCKHGISYVEVWPDAEKEQIKMRVYDAFDIYVNGSLDNIYDSQTIVKAVPMPIEEIKNNQDFDEEALGKISPDNKYASSEIKEAYMITRYGNQRPSDKTATLILKEAFIKEPMDDENIRRVAKDLGDDFGDRKKGDTVIRQIFEVAGITLRDKYVNLPDYPFIDLRLEPGKIYQVPLIERFIPANKSLDSIMSRLERYIGTMAVGAWLKRKGENFEVNNLSGGQVIEYESVPPTQLQVAPLPAFIFNYIQELKSIIEEQGASTSALGQTPPGVKSGVAIESLKATEYANLKIATDQMKDTVKRIAERMIDIAANNFISPQTVYHMENGQPDYFDIIGQKGMQQYQKLSKKKGSGVSMPNAVVLKNEYRVDIEIESGMGYTEEGKRATMIQILEYMRGLAKEGYLTPDSVAIVIKRFLEIFQFGSTQEFMEALEQGPQPVTDQQIKEMQVALLSVIKDLQGAQQAQTNPQPMPGEQVNGQAQPPQSSEDQDILKVKTGFMQAMSDLQNQQGQ